jgi:hypothetical protein
MTISVPLTDVHTRGCACDDDTIDEDCAQLRVFIAADLGMDGEIYVTAVRLR